MSETAALPALLAGNDVTVGVIGQGTVGALSAQLAARAGCNVIGYDRDSDRLAALERQSGEFANWRRVSDAGALDEADVLVIAVRIAITPDGARDDRSLVDVCSQLQRLRSRDRLVLLETTVLPGTSRRLAGALSDAWSSSRTLLAHCPERLRVGDGPDAVLRIPRLVGGVDDDSTALACHFLKRVGYQPVPVAGPEVAELAKLLENAFLTTGISLMSEVTQLAHALGVSAAEVAAAAATKPTGYHPFQPGPGIGGHCLGNDLALLRMSAARLGVRTPLLDGVAVATSRITASVLRHFRTLLTAMGSELSGSRVWIIGVGFKVGSGDTTATPAIEMVRELRGEGAEVVFSDPLVERFAVDGLPVERVSSSALPTDVLAAIVLSGDPTIDLADIARRVPVILDVGGARVMKGSVAGVRTL